MMKRTIRNTCITAIAALCALPAMAQLNGDGYYCFSNSKNTNHRISITNNQFSYQTVIGVAGGVSNATNSSYWPYMINCASAYLKNDIHLIDETDIISPGAVIYADKKNSSSTNYDYNLIGQGTSLLSMITGKYVGNNAGTIPVSGNYIQIQKVDGSGQTTRYKAWIELKASYLFWTINMGTRYFIDENGVFSLSENVPDSAMWYINPITHFNVFPKNYNGKYITTLKVPFEWQLADNSSVKAIYVITGVTDGVLQYQQITGTVPAGTPVILECSSPNPADCKLKPLGVPKFPDPSTDNNYAPAADTTSYYTGTNLLGGTYYCNTDGKVTYQKSATTTGTLNGNHFTPPTNLFELGLTQDGKFGFVPAQGITTAQGIRAMPANEAWMTQAGLFPAVAIPTITPASGTYTEAQNVIITVDEGCSAMYSTDGGNTWTAYTEPFTVNETTTIMARATKPGLYSDSDVASAEFVIENSTQILLGDVDNDGEIAIADVSALIDYLLGNNTDINLANADVNCDNEVSIADVSDLIDILLGNV